MRYSLITCALLFGFFTTTAKTQKQTLSVGHDLNQTATKSKENTIRCYTMEMVEQRRTKHSELHLLNLAMNYQKPTFMFQIHSHQTLMNTIKTDS